MSTDETVAQATTFLLAGTDTTSHTLAFALYSLAVNPEVQSKLEMEIRNCLEQNKVSCHGVYLILGGGYMYMSTHSTHFVCKRCYYYYQCCCHNGKVRS